MFQGESFSFYLGAQRQINLFVVKIVIKTQVEIIC